MPYNTKSVANLILNKAAENGMQLTPLKLQKLMYYVAGYYIAATNTPLIDTPIEAWEYGPVISSVYHEFKTFGSKPITRQAMDLDGDTGSLIPCPIPTGDQKLNKIVDFVLKQYGGFSGLTLSEMTHAAGTPWQLTRAENPGMRGVDIKNDLIKKHFNPLIKRKAA
jgi:uncharacterized phage-associated protein